MSNASIELTRQKQQSISATMQKQAGPVQDTRALQTVTQQSQKQMQQAQRQSVTGKFAQKYSQQKVPAMKLDKNESYGQLRDGQKVSEMQKAKRASAISEKLDLQEKVKNVKSMQAGREKMDEDTLTAMVRKHFGTEGEETVNTEAQGMQSLFTWSTSDPDLLTDDSGHNVTTGTQASVNIFEKIEGLSAESFAVRSDKDFVDELAEEYQIIQMVVSTKDLYDKYRAAGGPPRPELEERIESFTRLKAEYDERIEMYCSPYYVLLSDKDMLALDDGSMNTLDPKFAEYTRQFRKYNDDSQK
ncbi:MAG: hypothetical protein K6B72_05515 [Lachnospiraceae bacterium]|nr:hypothetical protein [Lachnospiraceae bacterium]